MSCKVIDVTLDCPGLTYSVDLSLHIINICNKPAVFTVSSCSEGTALINGSLLTWTALSRTNAIVSIVVSLNGSQDITIHLGVKSGTVTSPAIDGVIACPYSSFSLDIFSKITDTCGTPYSLVISNLNKGIANIVNGVVNWTGSCIYPNDYVTFDYTVTSTSGISSSNKVRMNLSNPGVVAEDLNVTLSCPYTGPFNLMNNLTLGCVTDLKVQVVQPLIGNIEYDQLTGVATYVPEVNSKPDDITVNLNYSGKINTADYTTSRKLNLKFNVLPELQGEIINHASNVTLLPSTVPANIEYILAVPTDPCGGNLTFNMDIPAGFGSYTYNNGLLTYIHNVPQVVFDKTFNYTFTSSKGKTKSGTVRILTSMGADPISDDTLLLIDNRSTLTSVNDIYGYSTTQSIVKIRETVNLFANSCPSGIKTGLLFSDVAVIKQVKSQGDTVFMGDTPTTFTYTQYDIITPGDVYTVNKVSGRGKVSIKQNDQSALILRVEDPPTGPDTYQIDLFNSENVKVFTATCRFERRLDIIFEPTLPLANFKNVNLDVATSSQKSSIVKYNTVFAATKDVTDIYALLNTAYKQLEKSSKRSIIIMTDFLTSKQDLIGLANKMKTNGVKIAVFLFRKTVDKNVNVPNTYETVYNQMPLGDAIELQYYTTTKAIAGVHSSMQNKTQQYVGESIASTGKFYHISSTSVDPLVKMQYIIDHGV
jgi:hypothetical protein